MPIAEAIMQDKWCRKDLYKSLKTSSSAWLVTYDFDLVKIKLCMSCLNLKDFDKQRLLMDLCAVPVILGTGLRLIALMYTMLYHSKRTQSSLY